MHCSHALPVALGLFLCLTGCGEKPLRAAALPALVTGTAPRDRAFPPAKPLVIAGERLTWEVRWRGLAIGRAEHVVATATTTETGVGRLAVRSRFRTAGLARELNPLTHDLIAHVALRPPTRRSSRDPIHNLHAALAALRGWAGPGAPPGELTAEHAGHRYHVEVASPRLEELPAPGSGGAAIRIDCRATRAGADVDPRITPTYITLWLSLDGARVPVRIDVVDDGFRAHAYLLEREVATPR